MFACLRSTSSWLHLLLIFLTSGFYPFVVLHSARIYGVVHFTPLNTYIYMFKYIAFGVIVAISMTLLVCALALVLNQQLALKEALMKACSGCSVESAVIYDMSYFF